MTSSLQARTAIRKALFCVALVLTSISSTGCWDKREIEELGFVIGAAIDIHKDTGDILLTVQIAKPFASQAGPSMRSGTNERPFWTVQGVGETVLDAATRIAEKAPRKPFWAHNDLVMFGEDFARQGIGDALDFLVRYRESRLRVEPIVVKGYTGNFAALSAESELNPLPSEAIRQMLQDTEVRLSTTSSMDVNYISQVLKTDGIEILLPALELVPVNPDEGTFGGELKREVISYSPKLAGSAVFRQDRLVGFLSPTETRGRQWVVGRVSRAVISTPHPREEENEVTFEVLDSISRVSLLEGSSVPSFRVEVDVTADLSDSDSYIDPLDSKLQTSLEQLIAMTIESEMRSALDKAQTEYNSDIFGFGELLYRRRPDLWQRLGPDWDSVLGTVVVDTVVNVRLAGTGLTFRGPKAED